MEGKKKRKFLEIFRALDSDGDGLISSEKCKVSGLGEPALELVQTILCTMEEKGLTLDKGKYLQEVQAAYMQLPHPHKQRLLEEGGKKREAYKDKDCVFHPAIN